MYCIFDKGMLLKVIADLEVFYLQRMVKILPFFFVFYSSFMATNNKQTNVQLIRKFDHWEYSWWKSLNPRMPWFDAKGTGRMALLTTSGSPTYYPSGSILWAGTDRHPADWILDYGMRDPGVIWYWVNEDDCDEDRKPGRMFLSYFFLFSFLSLFFSFEHSTGPSCSGVGQCYVTNKTFGQNNYAA